MNPTEEIQQKIRAFEQLTREKALTFDLAQRLSSRAAELVIENPVAGSDCLRQAIGLICKIATYDDPQIARAGVTALFPLLVERLNDSFDLANCILYDRVFSQVIEFCRRLPEGRQLDEGLLRFGLRNEYDLLARKATLPTLKPHVDGASFRSVKKVLLLSRVTIGADVAVTSTIIAKLRQVMLQAEFVILGSAKLRELYGGDARIRIREIAYERGGGLIARLTSWLDVVNAVNAEKMNLAEGEVWIIDPDSRLTQLGLLPLVEADRNYFLFESRSYQGNGGQSTISQLAAHWIGERIGNCDPAYPFVALPSEHRQFGRLVADQLRTTHPANPAPIRKLTTISFGVGGNQAKRVSDEFEERLVGQILTGAKLILDKGATNEEREQINRLVSSFRAQGLHVVELSEGNRSELLGQNIHQADVVTWDGSIGAFAGLIAASDQYIGYDSACQHVAAALGVPTLAIFVLSESPTFGSRWRPFGSGRIEVVTVEAKHDRIPRQPVSWRGTLLADYPIVLRTIENLLLQD